MTVSILTGDCRAVLKTLAEDSVDSCVTDPPYHLTSIVKRFGSASHDDATQTSERARNRSDTYAQLSTGFMGQTWDGGDVAFRPETWAEVLRVLKPGAHLLAFGGARTYHRLVCAIEDAGFEIRDQIMWIYGSGFPKSHDVSKGIDKAAGAERQRYERPAFGGTFSDDGGTTYGTAISNEPSTDAARQWEGWGTALKPAHEPIVLARKPLIGTVAANVQAHGTAALNIDGCRIGTGTGKPKPEYTPNMGNAVYGKAMGGGAWENTKGRWPANVIHDGSDEVLAGFPETKSDGGIKNPNGAYGSPRTWNVSNTPGSNNISEPSEGSAARFFYCAKASKADRDEGLNGFEAKDAKTRNAFIGLPDRRMKQEQNRLPSKNNHPTVKPTDLMRYLCRLITPPGGTVLDPFMGSGSTLKAARIEQFSFIGIDLDPAYTEIARARADADAPLFAEAVA